METESYDPSEQDELLAIFTDLLRGPTGDGGNKRARGDKPSWKVDSHEGSFWSHVAKWKKGELVDEHSGSHPMVHVAWRALAIAYQETTQVPWRIDYTTNPPRLVPDDRVVPRGGQTVGTPEREAEHEPDTAPRGPAPKVQVIDVTEE